MATDALGLAMALLAIHFAGRPPTANRTFGYARAEILAALANCLLLLGVGGYLLYEAVQRFITPADTRGGLAIVFAAGRPGREHGVAVPAACAGRRRA